MWLVRATPYIDSTVYSFLEDLDLLYPEYSVPPQRPPRECASTDFEQGKGNLEKSWQTQSMPVESGILHYAVKPV